MTFYHVSPKRGLTILRPHVPTDIDDECNIPRVCVCPSIPLAMDASGVERYGDDVTIYIYAIHAIPHVTPSMAYDMGTLDAPDMGEFWFLTPIPCEFVGVW